VSKNGWLALGVALGSVLALAVVFALRGGGPVAVTPEPVAGGVSTDGVPRPSSSAPGPAAMLSGQQAQAAPEESEEPGAPLPRAPTGVVESAFPDEPPPPLADDPFATENSREIDYAFQLVFGPDSSIESAKVAVDVFQRCLEAWPSNRRCYDGLVAAQERQKPGWTPPPPVQPLAPHPAMRARQETQPMPGLPPPVEAMPPLKPVKARPKEFHAR
jgi:hypothetical protein